MLPSIELRASMVDHSSIAFARSGQPEAAESTILGDIPSIPGVNETGRESKSAAGGLVIPSVDIEVRGRVDVAVGQANVAV